ncbi:MAG: MOSC domain-containing protein [Alphaproteobacteria bacterium]|nr:MOSC domain-containing protein [Alphaproteobacteria bacterium]
MAVTHLFIKPVHGEPLAAVQTFDFDQQGIKGNVRCSPFRQILLASRSGCAEYGLNPGELRENLVVDFEALYGLPSGTVVQIGAARIRLTFHCERCKKILHLASFDRLEHKRGVFGTFLNAGTISVGDPLVITDERFEEIPYRIGERIRWFLSRGEAPAAAVDLVHKIGLPASCARALPKIMRKLSWGKQ